MQRNILYTYENTEEFNRYLAELEAEGKDILPFVFQETKEVIEESINNIIDITLLIENILTNKQDRLPAFNNLKNLNDQNKIIVRFDLSDSALDIFSVLFNYVQTIYDPKENLHTEKKFKIRRTIYSYSTFTQLEQVIEYASHNGIPFLSFNQASNKAESNILELDKREKPPIVDITIMIRAAMSKNATILYLAEQLIDSLENTVFITDKDSAVDVLENLPIYFNKHASISEIFADLGVEESIPAEEQNLKRIIDCNAKEIDEFEAVINCKLVGHDYFKERLLKSLRNFIKLNRINEKKIFSVFLLGQSGLGKTEVARIVNEFLNPYSSLAKINFGNYSSQDALNSLIGSPAGYVGCESGELGIKVQKSKAGVIVCDEFEKTTRPIFYFFLELLEDGTFTDSLAREYDLDGYIIIFTSNLLSDNDFYKEIPPELQSRIDLVCEFKPLTIDEKKKYVEYQRNYYLQKLANEFSKHVLTPEDMSNLINVNFQNTDNLRDIKRMVEQKVIEFLDA